MKFFKRKTGVPPEAWEPILTSLKEALDPIRPDWYKVTLEQISGNLDLIDHAPEPSQVHLEYSDDLDDVLLAMQTFAVIVFTTMEKYIAKPDRDKFAPLLLDILWLDRKGTTISEYLNSYNRLFTDTTGLHMKMARDIQACTFGPGNQFGGILVRPFVEDILQGACIMTATAFGDIKKANSLLPKQTGH